MSDTDRSARPRQLTMAGGFVIGGSIFLVLSVFDTFTNLNSVEMRDQIAEVLSTPSGEGLGLTIEQAKAVMRVGLMIAAACAAAAAVLGVYALQRSRQARLALSILAVPILLTAPLTGGFVGALVAAATLMLWSGPARDWYAGRPTRQVEPPHRGSHPGPWEETMPSPDERNRGHDRDYDRDPVAPPGDSTSPTTPSGAPASSLSTAGSSSAPASTSGFGQAPDPALPAQPPGGATPAYDAMTTMSTRTPVPVAVKVSCIVTWVFAGLVALLYLAMLFVLIVSQDRMVDLIVDTPEWERANLDADMLVPVLWVGCLMFLGWALTACLLAWFTWRRHNWARWLLVVSAAVTLVAATFAFPVGIPHQLAALVTIAGLFSVQARAWFASQQSWTSGPPSGPPGSYPPGPSYPSGSYPSGSYPPGPSAPGPSGPDTGQGAGPGQGQDQGAGAPPQSPPPGGKPPVW